MFIAEYSRSFIPPQIWSRLGKAVSNKKACWLKFSVGNEGFEEYLLITNERVVKLERIEGQQSLCQVDDMGRLSSMCSNLAKRMKWSTSSSMELPALTLSRSQFDRVLRHSDELNMEEIMMELLKSCPDEAGVIDLARCLKLKRVQGYFTFLMANGEEWEGQRAQFIICHSMNWLVRSSTKEDEDWLIASPMSKVKLQELMIMWLRQSK
ncbi:hypothetical protein [Paenibacillus segetis]|uniref:Cyclic nucleotide-binding domain-containing protein n=1 Tax=Paenibacillus segetis TaxID=1325360 RepID=A0ABQ1YAJ8_9BACL|nr:hypothetical protein [Paenibacillus segetis]GGH18318.1 hypothetical protein GCM10008013_14210 [Paenibacillus segetis]